LLALIRRLAGEAWRPLELALRHAEPPSTHAHESLDASRIRFSQPADAIRLAARDLGREVPGANRYLLPIAERQLEDVLSERVTPDAWLSEVEILIGKQICDGHPHIRGLAPQLGLSVRTFQRRLREREVVYRDLVADVRRQLARRYLEETRTDLEEIAFLLGYSELSAFDRAFRRWIGRSPSEHRRATRA
jgi:AraC-like DNA-binding protein